MPGDSYFFYGPILADMQRHPAAAAAADVRRPIRPAHPELQPVLAPPTPTVPPPLGVAACAALAPARSVPASLHVTVACSCCLEPFTREALEGAGDVKEWGAFHCGHMICTGCAAKWFSEAKRTCPLCRAPVFTYYSRRRYSAAASIDIQKSIDELACKEKGQSVALYLLQLWALLQ